QARRCVDDLAEHEPDVCGRFASQLCKARRHTRSLASSPVVGRTPRRTMKLPSLSRVERDATHRLIPYRYSDRGKPILNLLAKDDDDLLNDLTELEGATNDRLLGETGRLPGVTTIELVSGFRLAHIVNAAFTHGNPLGGRFNSAGRGAWYAGFEMQTAQSEVAYHRAAELKEIGWME